MNIRTATRSVALIAALAAALALAGCSSSSPGTAETTPAASGGNSSLDNALAEVEAIDTSNPVPTEPVSGVSALAGSTVYYIPITMQAPQFSTTSQIVTEALKSADITVQTCDGKGTPTDVGNCISQAIGAKASAIIADAIPYGLAQTGFDQAQAAGIPVVLTNQDIDPAHPASATLGYVPAGAAQETALLEWIAKDSGGKADILINVDHDGAAQPEWVKTAEDQLAKDCPGCKVTENAITSANFPQIAPSVSAALTSDPNVDYVVAQFAQFLQPVQGGIQAAGATSSVKLVVGAAQLDTLKAVKNGQVQAATAQSAPYMAWTEADLALRLMTKSKVPDYAVAPIRLFTADNIGSITLTEAASKSGEWIGPATLADQFKALWGIG